MKGKPTDADRQVTEIRIINKNRVTMAEGHRVHNVSCSRVVERPGGILEIGFGWTNNERIVLHTSVQILKEFVPQLIEDLQENL